MTVGCIMAVDPGLTGAIAFYSSSGDLLDARDMPVVKQEIDAATLTAFIDEMRPRVALVEQVGARPGQGVSSMFKFGAGFGMVRGVIAARGVPLHLVTPGKWKKHFSLGADKEASRAMALRLWPGQSGLFSRKKDHGRAEAALLARYAHIHRI